jgi:hypothetical protein
VPTEAEARYLWRTGLVHTELNNVKLQDPHRLYIQELMGAREGRIPDHILMLIETRFKLTHLGRMRLVGFMYFNGHGEDAIKYMMKDMVRWDADRVTLALLKDFKAGTLKGFYFNCQFQIYVNYDGTVRSAVNDYTRAKIADYHYAMRVGLSMCDTSHRGSALPYPKLKEKLQIYNTYGVDLDYALKDSGHDRTDPEACAKMEALQLEVINNPLVQVLNPRPACLCWYKVPTHKMTLAELEVHEMDLAEEQYQARRRDAAKRKAAARRPALPAIPATPATTLDDLGDLDDAAMDAAIAAAMAV